MPDRAVRVVVARKVVDTRDVGGVLRDRERARGHGEPGPEGRVYPRVVADVHVPALEVLVDVGDVHVRPADEVAIRDLDEPEGLQVRDSSRAEVVRQRRGEAEEELGLLRDQLGARHAGGECHLARETAAREPLAYGRALEHSRIAEEGALGVGDVVEVVAAEEHDHVVLLEERVLGIAREADGVEQRRALRPAVQRLQPLPLRSDETWK